MIKYLLAITLISFGVQATDLNDCMEHAQTYGDGKGRSAIPAICSNIIATKASPQTYANNGSSSDSNFAEAYAVNKLIYAHYKDKNGVSKQSTIAGSSTMIETIHKIKVDPAINRLIILANENIILTFDYKSSGNIAPLTRIESPDFRDAVDILPATKQNKLFVLLSDGRIIEYLAFADINGTRPGNSMSIQREMKLATVFGELSSFEWDAKNERLFVYDRGLQKIHEFKWDLKSDPESIQSRNIASEVSEIRMTDEGIVAVKEDKSNVKLD